MGLRRSEMLLIKTSDIHWHNRQLAVVNTEDESLDPRTMAPQFKTNERMLVMTDDLYDAIAKYESKYRHRKPVAAHRRQKASVFAGGTQAK